MSLAPLSGVMKKTTRLAATAGILLWASLLPLQGAQAVTPAATQQASGSAVLASRPLFCYLIPFEVWRYYPPCR